jgi:hypothetical protein
VFHIKYFFGLTLRQPSTMRLAKIQPGLRKR